jgi:hypothetical protein
MKFLRVGRKPSRKAPAHTHLKGSTLDIKFRFPTELASDRALANQLRAEAIEDLMHAIEIAELCVRISATPEQYEHASFFLESLREQVPPPSIPTRQAKASVECRAQESMAGGAF